SNPQSLRQVMCDFVDGHIPAVTFRLQLQRFDVVITPMLDKLIRTHECDNCVTFGDLARLMLRQDRDAPVEPSQGRGFSSAGSSGGRSGAVTPTPSSRSGRLFAPPPREGGGMQFPSGFRADDARSVASQSEYSCASAQRSQVQPPYAIGQDLLPSQQRSQQQHRQHTSQTQQFQAHEQQRQLQPQRARSTSGAQTRAPGHHGDILGWNQPATQVPSTSSSRMHVRAPGTSAKEQATMLHWPQERGEGAQPQLGRPGRRLYDRGVNSEKAPFGTISDVSPPGQYQSSLASPFGTDQDMRLRRPEEAGTDEYRPAMSRGPHRR
ncbi:unnamed protein product, partial [Polarella glacialis]